MSDEVRSLVDRRWAEYGLGEDVEDGNGRARRSLRQLLRR